MTDTPLTEQRLAEIDTRAAHLHKHATLTDRALQAAANHLAGEDVPAMRAEIGRLKGQRDYLLGQLARKDATTGEGDRKLREFLGGEPEPGEAQALAHRDAEVMRRCAAFVRDTYDGQWADDAAATLERDADVAEHGCPGYEDAGQGDTEAERRLANCKHCGRPRAACLAAPEPAPVEGETDGTAAAGHAGEDGAATEAGQR